MIRRLLSGKPLIYTIEINDEKINNDVGKLLYDGEKHITELINALREEDVATKTADHKALSTIFLNLHKRIRKLKKDLDKIIDLELQQKEYIIIKDQNFIEDKKRQLSIMQQALEKLISILKDNPTINDYNQGLISVMMQELNSFIEATDHLRNDDKTLAKIYESLCQI